MGGALVSGPEAFGPRTDREVREGGKPLYLPFRKNAMRTKKCSPALGRIADSVGSLMSWRIS